MSIFLVFAWEFCIEKWRGFWWIFSGLHLPRCTKTHQKIRGKLGAKFGAKFGTKIQKIRGTFVLQLFWPKILEFLENGHPCVHLWPRIERCATVARGRLADKRKTLSSPKRRFERTSLRRTPKGAHSTKGRSRHLLETAFSKPLLRTLLRTLFYCKTHRRPPSQNPSENPFPRTVPRTFSKPFSERCVAVRPLRRAPCS